MATDWTCLLRSDSCVSRIIYFGGYGCKTVREINNVKNFTVDHTSWVKNEVLVSVGFAFTWKHTLCVDSARLSMQDMNVFVLSIFSSHGVKNAEYFLLLLDQCTYTITALYI